MGRCTESQSFSLWTAVPFPLPFTVHLFNSWPQTDLESTGTWAGCCFFPMAPAQQWLFLPQKHRVGFMFSYNPRLAILHNHLSLQDKAISKTFINCNEKIAPKEKLRRQGQKKHDLRQVQGSLQGCQLPGTPTQSFALFTTLTRNHSHKNSNNK